VRVMEKTSTGYYCGSSAVIPLEVTMAVAAGGPIFFHPKPYQPKP
jgi:hypothetical protein